MLNIKIEDKIPEYIYKKLLPYIGSNASSFTVVETRNTFNIKENPSLGLLVNLEKTNNFKNINKFHETVNSILINEGIYCSCVETDVQRKKRKWKTSSFLLGPFLMFLDFVYKRVIPKLPIIKKIYFSITRGHNRVISKTEALGRLISCGFKINTIFEHKNLSYIICTKIRKPYFDMDPSYGPIFKMKRIGINGSIISVYKFRTMSPYSEYVQKDISEENKFNKSGKIKNDYRVTFYGKFFRKYWIDELPMIINLFKRDLKFVGVRPLSEHYFNKYPKDLQQLRIKTKPGLIPPYYVDLPITFDEICLSEKKYLDKYFKKPIRTDINYFFKAIWNILIKGSRSS